MRCGVCPRACEIKEGGLGFCGARTTREGRVVPESYGVVTAMALDPIEKKPLRRFFPGSRILSVGSYGCNFRCPFCQNYGISMAKAPVPATRMAPEELADRAESLRPDVNIGLAYTYNEPLVAYEFVRDCAAAIRARGMKNVAVTNGYINPEPLSELLPLIDAWNIDLKSFSPEFYRWIGGELEPVKETIRRAAAVAHVEVTTLVIPGKNDGVTEMRALSRWLASVDPAIPLHISRFFPRYQLTDRGATPASTIHELTEVAREALLYVYPGNL